MKQKLLAFLFSFILMLSLIAPFGVDIAYADGENEVSSGETGASSDGKTQNSGADTSTWEGLQAAINASKGDVTFQLSGDIAAGNGAAPITIKNGKKVTIDLGGHTINRGLGNDTPDGEVIHVEGGATLTLNNSSDTPGTITGGANTGNGGGILCDDKAKLTIDGGIKIINNRAAYGAGICLGAEGELYLGTCTVNNNSCSVFGGGIYGGSSRIIFIGGRVRINENYKGNDTSDQNDLYMPAEMEKLRFWYVTGAGTRKEKEVYAEEFRRGTLIGILLEERAKEISEGYGECNQVEASTFFFYNKEDLEISSDQTKSEVTIVRTEKGLHSTSNSTLEVYRGGKLKATEQFNSFLSAFNRAADVSADEKIVIMGSDYSSDEQIVLEKDKSVVVDLNGHTIKRDRENHETKRNGGVFLVKSGATLTIRDSSPKRKGNGGVRGGVITGGASSNAGGGITVEEKGHLVMEGGTIYDCTSDEDGGGVYVDTGSKETSFVMRGGRIANCKTIDSADNCCGGAIFFGDGKLDLKDGTIDGCYSEDDGGAIYCKRGEVNLENMIFSTNKSREDGGAIYIDLDLAKYDGTLFYAKGCSFIENEAMEDGGAFYMRDNPEHKGALMFDHCIFRNNTARENGGALVACDDGMVLSNVEITGNSAGEYGGGVFVDARYTVNVKGVVVIKNNTSNKYSNCRDMCLEDGVSNTAFINSGGLSKGSWIGVGSTSKKSIKLANNMSVYEMKYFHSHVGSISSKNVREVEVEMVVTGSLFSVGNTMLISVMGGIGLVLLVILIIRRKKPGNVNRTKAEGGGL